MPAIVIALFLVAHGLIHAAFLAPAPPAKPGSPTYPFTLARSWLLSGLGAGPRPLRLIGALLVVIAIAGYLVAALSLVGFGPASWFAGAVVIGSVASIVLLVLFFHRWLVLGVVIDAVLLWAVLVNGWIVAGAG